MNVIDLIHSNTTALVWLSIALGLMVGSFLNVVIYRVPVMLQREWRAQCCEFLELDEKKVKIEMVTGGLSGLVAWHFGAGWLCLAMLCLTWSLIALTMLDFDHQLLPDNITLPLLWLGLLVNSLLPESGVSAQEAILGAAIGYLSLWSVYWAFKFLTGKEGMGYGDFKLLAALGAWMGWKVLLLIVILSSLVGAIVGIALLLFLGRDRNVPIPFGPYLAGAGFITLIWGPTLMNTYFSRLAG